MEISAIFPGFVQAFAPAPDSAPEGLFLALMSEVTAPLPEEAIAQKVEPPAEWALLNANPFKGTATPEGETPEAEPEKPESSNNLLTVATPAVVIEAQPLRPLTVNITFATVAVKEQENTVEEVNVTRPAPIERRGESAPKAELAFTAKIISKDDVTIETPEVKPEVKVEVEPQEEPEVKLGAKPEAKPTVKTEAKPETKPEAKPQAKPEIAPVEPRPLKAPAADAAQHDRPEPAEQKPEVQRSTEAVETREGNTPKLEAAMPAAVPVKNSTVQETTKPQPVQPAARIVEIEPPVEPRTTEPVREVSVAIEGAEGGRVRLRMETQAGELRAWVTGNNAETVERVRAELPELSRGLKDAGVKAEVWRPDSVRETRAASELQGGSEYGQRSSEGNDRQYDEGSRRRRPQPDWFEQEDE